MISAFETVLNSRYGGDDLLEEFSSPIKVVAPNTYIEPEHKDKHWEHHACLLAGVQTIQISYFGEYSTFTDDMSMKAKLYVFNNNEIVLYDRGRAKKRIRRL